MKRLVKTRVLATFCLLTLALLATACKRLPDRPEDLPSLYPVRLNVTFGGAPVEGVTVNMTPLDPALKKWKSGGQLDAEGRLEVKTGFYYEGAPEGEYRISFAKLQERWGDTLEDMQPLSLIPLKYGPLKSELTVSVKPEKNDITLELDGGEEIVPVPKGATLNPRMKKGAK